VGRVDVSLENLQTASWSKGYCLVPTILKAIALNYFLIYRNVGRRILPDSQHKAIAFALSKLFFDNTILFAYFHS